MDNNFQTPHLNEETAEEDVGGRRKARLPEAAEKEVRFFNPWDRHLVADMKRQRSKFDF